MCVFFVWALVSAHFLCLVPWCTLALICLFVITTVILSGLRQIKSMIDWLIDWLIDSKIRAQGRQQATQRLSAIAARLERTVLSQSSLLYTVMSMIQRRPSRMSWWSGYTTFVNQTASASVSEWLESYRTPSGTDLITLKPTTSCYSSSNDLWPLMTPSHRSAFPSSSSRSTAAGDASVPAGAVSSVSSVLSYAQYTPPTPTVELRRVGGVNTVRILNVGKLRDTLITIKLS